MNHYNKKFKQDYDKIFKEDPLIANTMLLFMDLADGNGRFELPANEDEAATEINMLLFARFENPEEYQL